MPSRQRLREAEEEIALPPGMVEVIGRSDTFRTGTGFAIEPIIGIVPPDLPLQPADGEVEAIFEVPLDFLLDSANRELKTVDWPGGKREVIMNISGKSSRSGALRRRSS